MKINFTGAYFVLMGVVCFLSAMGLIHGFAASFSYGATAAASVILGIRCFNED